ncbi:helix-turn-helix domain-containing protein [Streptomyces sp. NPDC054919]
MRSSECSVALATGTLVEATIVSSPVSNDSAIFASGDRWVEVAQETFTHLNISSGPSGSVFGTVDRGRLGWLRATAIEASPQWVFRTPRLISADGDNHVMTILQITGTSVVSQGDKEAQLHPGDFILLDTNGPFGAHFPVPFKQEVFALPREMLDVSEEGLQRIAGRTFSPSRGLGALISSYLSELPEVAKTSLPEIEQRLARNTADLLGALIIQESGQGVSGRAIMLQIQRFIVRNLGDPDLSPEMIAAAHNISVRYLHKLFQSESMTVTRWIRQRRLEGSRQDLARSQPGGLTVAAIAHRWGFASHPHFTRVFRQAYGMSPNEWREMNAEKPSRVVP